MNTEVVQEKLEKEVVRPLFKEPLIIILLSSLLICMIGIMIIGSELNIKATDISEVTFPNELICAKKEGKYGFINKKGEVVIEFKYDDATDFVNGLATVKIGDEWNVINTKGKNILGKGYQNTYIDKEGLIRFVENDKYGFMDFEGNIISEAKFDKINVFKEGISVFKIDETYGYIKSDGTIIGLYDNALSFSNGYGLVYNKDFGYFFIDKQGKILYTNKFFETATSFINDFTIIGTRETGGKMMYSIIDRKGNIIIDNCKIIYSRFNRDFYIAYKDGHYFIINENGKVLNKEGYLNIRGINSFENIYYTFNIMDVKKLDGTRYIINKDNEILQDNLDENAIVRLDISDNQTMFAIENGSITDLYNYDGKLISTFDVKLIKYVNGLLTFETDQGYGVINEKGETIIESLYDDINLSYDGYIFVEKDGKCGIFNDKGDIIIPIEYDGFKKFHNGTLVYRVTSTQ